MLMGLLLTASAGAQGQFIPTFDLQGHRGARGLFPENSVPGFLAALDQGVTTLEMDVVITADKKVIVSHEPWMSAAICTDSSGNPITPADEKKHNIYKMTYEQVQLFDCGSIGNKDFPEQIGMESTKPLLSDVIRYVEHYIKDYTRYQVDYNIEIKSDAGTDNQYHPEPGEYADLVYEIVDAYLPWRRVVIQSFDLRVLRYLHENHPAVRLSLLVENLQSPDVNIKKLGFRPQVYSPGFKLLSQQRVIELHQKSIRVIPWTVNDPEDMARLVQWGVDGFITDYPNRAMVLGLSKVKKPEPPDSPAVAGH